MGGAICCGMVFYLYRGIDVHTRSVDAVPVLFCGVASTASLAVGLRPFKVHAHARAIVPLVSIGAATLIHAATRGRIHGFAVLTGMLLTYIVLRSCPQRKMLGIWMLCFGAAAPVWVVLLNMVQDLTVFEPLFLASLLGQVRPSMSSWQGDCLLVCAHARYAHRARTLG